MTLQQAAQERIAQLHGITDWIERNPDKIEDLQLANGAYTFCEMQIQQTRRDMKKNRPARQSSLRSRLRNLLASIVPQNNKNVKDGIPDVQ